MSCVMKRLKCAGVLISNPLMKEKDVFTYFLPKVFVLILVR